MIRLCATAIGLWLALAPPASADWRPDQRSDFMKSCVEACRPKAASSNRDKCDAACECVMTEGDKFLSAADYDEMNEDARAGRTNANRTRFDSYIPICAKRVMGR